MTAVFIHIPKTGGASIQSGLALQQYRNRRALVKGAEYTGLVTFGHEPLDRLIRSGYVEGKDLLTFAFCRNPYDRAVSLWAHHGRDYAPGMTFLDFCRRLPSFSFRYRTPQARWLDGVDVGFLGRYESLRGDFGRLCDWLGVERRDLPRLNMGDRGPCSMHYDDEAMAIVRAHYARDFERFGYADDHLPD